MAKKHRFVNKPVARTVTRARNTEVETKEGLAVTINRCQKRLVRVIGNSERKRQWCRIATHHSLTFHVAHDVVGTVVYEVSGPAANLSAAIKAATAIGCLVDCWQAENRAVPDRGSGPVAAGSANADATYRARKSTRKYSQPRERAGVGENGRKLVSVGGVPSPAKEGRENEQGILEGLVDALEKGQVALEDVLAVFRAAGIEME